MAIAPSPNHTSSAQATSTSRNIFEDPAIQEAARNDVFVRFVALHWRSILLTIAALGLVVVAYSVFTKTAERKRAAATTLLADIQENYRSLVRRQDELARLRVEQAAATADNADKEIETKIVSATTEVTQLKDKVNLMIDALDSPKPFDSLASLYKGLVAARFQEYETARVIVADAAWQNINNRESTERFIAEVTTLALAKALAESEAHVQQAKDALQALAEQGNFIAVEAVGTLSLLVSNPEEKTRVRELTKELAERFPAQARYLTEVAERL